ncbi:MAG: TolC family outer membrane protein [Sphingobium sp.]
MKKVIIRGGVMVLGAVVMTPASAQEIAPLSDAVAPAQGKVATLAEAIGAAIDAQPEVQARWEAFLAAGEDRKAARAGYFPTVDVNGQLGRAARDYDRRGWFTRDHAEVAVSQMLFDGFLTSSRVAQAGQARLASYFDLLDAVQQKALEAILAYEDVRQYRATVALAEENLAAHADVVKLMKERESKGVGTSADLDQANGRYALAQANLLTEQANLYDVTARFQRITGRMPAENLADFAVASASVPAGFDAVLAQAVQKHPSLYAAHARVQEAKAAITEAQAGYYPRLSLDGRAGTYRNTSSFDSSIDPNERGEEAFVGVRMSYNLFRGGGDKARESAATRRLNQSKDLLNKTCVDLRQTASIAWNNVENLKVKMRSLDLHRQGAAKVATAYEQQFYIGRRTLLDVLDARNEAFQSQRAYVQAGHELTKSYYSTLNSMGILMDVVGQDRRGLPGVGELDSKGRLPSAIDCGGVFVG